MDDHSYGHMNHNSNKPMFIGLGVFCACIGAYGATYFVIKSKIDQKIAEVNQEFANQVKVEYDSLKFNPFKSEISLHKVGVGITGLKNAKTKDISIEMKKVRWSKCDFWNDPPNHCTITVTGLTAKSSDPMVKMALDQYQKSVGVPLTQDVLLKYDYNPDADFAFNFNAQIALRGMFKMEYRVKSSGMDLAAYRNEAQKLMAQKDQGPNDFKASLAVLDNVKKLFENLKLELVSFDMHDKGGVVKLMDFMAKTTGKSVEDLKLAMHKEVKKTLKQKELAKLKTAVDNFIDKPKSIGIVYKPEKVEKMADMIDPTNPFAGVGLLMESTKVKINKDSFGLDVVLPVFSKTRYTH